MLLYLGAFLSIFLHPATWSCSWRRHQVQSVTKSGFYIRNNYVFLSLSTVTIQKVLCYLQASSNVLLCCGKMYIPYSVLQSVGPPRPPHGPALTRPKMKDRPTLAPLQTRYFWAPIPSHTHTPITSPISKLKSLTHVFTMCNACNSFLF